MFAARADDDRDDDDYDDDDVKMTMMMMMCRTVWSDKWEENEGIKINSPIGRGHVRARVIHFQLYITATNTNTNINTNANTSTNTNTNTEYYWACKFSELFKMQYLM